jgi:putative ABC transport system permease protein
VIGPEVKKALFGGRDPLGEYITIRGLKYRVIGLYRDEGNENELRKIYVPITTAQLVYNQPNAVHNIMYTFGDADLEKSERIVEETRRLLAQRHRFDPKDRRAVGIQNNLVGFLKMVEVFRFIDLFVWIAGIGTVFAGVIGVGNIMLISVKERTVEIGVRKALGATPWSIVSMVLKEALFITSVSGYVGLVAGAGLVEVVNRYLPNNDYFNNPQVDFSAALTAVGVLIMAGVLAGLAPALRAARIQPVEAMREG